MHRLVVIVLAVILAAAVVVGQAELWFSWFALDELPVACSFRRATGHPCPGCGLTRSWSALGRGALGESLAYHRLGWAVMLYTALQLARHALWLTLPGIRSTIDRTGRWLDWGLVVLIVGLFVNWGLVLLGR
jgi:hypothetical protein